MHVESISIENHKSFLDRQSLRFEPGFNLLVRANNAGKTTVLDVVDMESGINEPHRSAITIPLYGGQPHQMSEFEVALATSFNELRTMVGWSQVSLPLAAPDGDSSSCAPELLDRVVAFAADEEH